MRSLNWESLREMCAPPATSGRALMLCWPGLSESVASSVVRSMTQLQKAQNSARCAHVRRLKTIRPQVCVGYMSPDTEQSTFSMADTLGVQKEDEMCAVHEYAHTILLLIQCSQ